MNTFEDFLTDCVARGASQVRLVPRVRGEDEQEGIAFYAHPQGVDGDTFDGIAVGDTIFNMKQPEPMAEPVEGTNEPVFEKEPEVLAVVELSDEEIAAIAGTEAPAAK